MRLFQEFIRNRLLSAGLEQVLSQTEKLCYSIEVRTIYLRKYTSFVRPKGNLISADGKLSIIRCYK